MADENPGAKAPVDTDLRIGGEINRVRRTRGLSQENLAQMVGVSPQQMQKYERGANRVSASRLEEIARVLKVPIDQFFTRPAELEHVDGIPGLEIFLADPRAVSLIAAWSKLSQASRTRLCAFLESVVAADSDPDPRATPAGPWPTAHAEANTGP